MVMSNSCFIKGCSCSLGRSYRGALEAGQRVVGCAWQPEQFSDLPGNPQESSACCDAIVHDDLPEPMNKFRLPETFLAKLKAARINPASRTTVCR